MTFEIYLHPSTIVLILRRMQIYHPEIANEMELKLA